MTSLLTIDSRGVPSVRYWTPRALQQAKREGRIQPKHYRAFAVFGSIRRESHHTRLFLYDGTIYSFHGRARRAVFEYLFFKLGEMMGYEVDPVRKPRSIFTPTQSEERYPSGTFYSKGCYHDRMSRRVLLRSPFKNSPNPPYLEEVWVTGLFHTRIWEPSYSDAHPVMFGTCRDIPFLCIGCTVMVGPRLVEFWRKIGNALGYRITG